MSDSVKPNRRVGGWQRKIARHERIAFELLRELETTQQFVGFFIRRAQVDPYVAALIKECLQGRRFE